jgi:hypothetical protein
MDTNIFPKWFTLIPEKANDFIAVMTDGRMIDVQERTPQNEVYVNRMVNAWNEYDQLKEDKAALLEALKMLYDSIDSCIELTPHVLLKARQAILQATK